MSELREKEKALLLGMFILIVFGGIFLWVFSSYQEAESFNRLTGGSATMWDAMWTQLRVQASPLED